MIETFVQQIAGGVAAGSLYALVALGLTLIYKISDVVNFGHGDMAMVGTFIAYTLLISWNWPLPLAFLSALAFAGALGIIVERVILRPARERHATVLTLVVATLGISLVLNGAAGAIWGHDVKSFPYAVVGPPLRLGEATISRDQVLDIGVGVGLALVLALFFRFTDLGIAMRATAQNTVAARLMGIPTDRIFAVTWALGAALGALAGILIAPVVFLDTNVMNEMLIKGFAAAVLGGFTSLPGAVVGGVALGVLENLVAGYISTELKTTFAFALIVVVLAVQPAGLLGGVKRKQV